MKKRISFFEATGTAILISVVGAILFSVLSSLFSGGLVLRLLTSVLAFAYIIYLLVRSTERNGRISVIVIWLLFAPANLLLVDSLLMYLSLHIAAIWLIRSLYYYNSLFSSMTDLVLTVFSLVAAIFAWHSSHSLLLALWCFFLLQALFSFIPPQLARSEPGANDPSAADAFNHAYKSAQAAVHKLTTIN